MNPIIYDRYGRNVAQQTSLFFENLPGIGGVVRIIAQSGEAQKPIVDGIIPVPKSTSPSNIFYLEDILPEGMKQLGSVDFTPSLDTKYPELIQLARNHYPKPTLPADSVLYLVVNGHVLEAKTKKFKPFESLGDFVSYVEASEKEAAVVGVNRKDDDALSSITHARRFWGISETRSGDLQYRVYTYGQALRRPPKYQRKKIVK